MAPSLPAAEPTQRDMEREAKINELRERLSQADGAKAAEQLVQGGEFKAACELTTEQNLSRWLRARGWDVDRAYNAIIKHAEWRANMMPTGRIEESTIANELACEKAYIQGCDKKGRPILIIQVRKHNAWTRYIDELERLCCYMLDRVVALADSELNPRKQCVALLDLTDMGTMSMDVQAIKTLFSLLGEHYVERLGAMFFYNPPYLFWGAWNTLSPLLPEPTRAKIQVIDPATQGDVLLQSIDADVLPREYGGNADMLPPLGKQ